MSEDKKELPVYAVQDGRTLNMRLAGRMVQSEKGVLRFETQEEADEFAKVLAKSPNLRAQVQAIDFEAAQEMVRQHQQQMRAMAARGTSNSLVNATLAQAQLNARDAMLAKTGVKIEGENAKELVTTELTEVGQNAQKAQDATAALAALQAANKGNSPKK